MNTLGAIAFIAERKIEDAIANGEFENLPGMGKPLEIEDLSHLPPDMRMAYTILKNSGYTGALPEKEQCYSVRDMLPAAGEERACYARMQKLKVVLARVERVKDAMNREAGTLTSASGELTCDNSPYLEKVLSKI